MDNIDRLHNDYLDMSSSDEEENDAFSLMTSSESEFEDDDAAGRQRQSSHLLLGSSNRSSALAAGIEDVCDSAITSMRAHRRNNLALKMRQSEYLPYSRFKQQPKPLFTSVPKRLSFCFKDLVQTNLTHGHMFMGLTACGQFMLSYKVCSADVGPTTNHYSFSMGYKYTLYFWIFEPFKPLRGYYKCLLFDDHGVDNLKEVSMIQWMHGGDKRILIVHGASDEENEDCYITYVKVPKLGCLDCRKLRDLDEEVGHFCRQTLCLKCNLTLHTKYSTTESDCKFDPYLHLICPERILLISNGFFHVVRISIEPPPKEQSNPILLTEQQQQNHAMSVLMLRPTAPLSASLFNQLHDPHRSTPPAAMFAPPTDIDQLSVDSQMTNNSQGNLISRLQEDFPDIETDSTHSGSGVAMAAPHRLTANGLRSPPGSSVAPDSPISAVTMARASCDELVFTCGPSSSSRVSANTLSGAATNCPGPVTSTGGSTAISPKGPRRRHRIVTKTFRKGVSMFFSTSGVTTTHASPNTSNSSAGTSASSNDRSSAYEFCEENEKCEKISIFRKRRLAERKYEFSEDNSENIIPFTTARSAANTSLRASTSHAARHGLTHMNQPRSPYASPSSSPHPQNSNVANNQYELSRHYSAPSALSPLRQNCSSPIGFRSPPSTSGLVTHPSSSGMAYSGPSTSANAAAMMRSPSRHLVTNNSCNNHRSPNHSHSQSMSPAMQFFVNFSPHNTLAPLQLTVTKRLHLERGGSISPNYQFPNLSPRREDMRPFEVPLLADAVPEKPMCTKRFHRRYVEEDDAASVITSEEDDCISPGYHTLLPLEVHGSCYSEMQMISKASFQQLRCSSVVIQQDSFDMETFTYYAISALCHKNDKIYDFFYDWAYEVVQVCPVTSTMFCLLMAHFSARDHFGICICCTRKLNCIYHCRQYECRIMFSWNLATCEWDVLDYGELHDQKVHRNERNVPLTLPQHAKKLAVEMKQTLKKLPDYKGNLRILESNINKSKKTITDLHNVIEFYLKRRPEHSS